MPKSGITAILGVILNSQKNKSKFSEKCSLFFSLTNLFIYSKFNKKTNDLVTGSFLNFKVSGYSYNNLAYLLSEIFISNEYFFTPTTSEPVIIDCGANIGMSILYFKKLFPNSKIIAFEANPNAYKLLEKNMLDNEIQNVELHNIALFDKETEISFFISDDKGTLLGSTQAERGGTFELKVPAQKLSTYLKNIQPVDLIKMDVEGAEIEIIADLFDSTYISKAKEYIIEYHHNVGESKSGLSSFLQKFESNGYNYSIKTDFEVLNEFQDILIHFYKN